MIIVRLCKIVFVASVALFFTIVAFGNVTDYNSNWQFVQHVLSMDTTFPDSSLHWRAITDPTLQTAGYWLIIATEIVTAILLWAGAFRLLGAVNGPDFNRAKSIAVAGLGLGFLLYMVGFGTIASEWFAMWQSQTWNAQHTAFDFLTMIIAVLIFVVFPDPAAD
jgi:predicted small integral membrane protein